MRPRDCSRCWDGLGRRLPWSPGTGEVSGKRPGARRPQGSRVCRERALWGPQPSGRAVQGDCWARGHQGCEKPLSRHSGCWGAAALAGSPQGEEGLYGLSQPASALSIPSWNAGPGAARTGQGSGRARVGRGAALGPSGGGSAWEAARCQALSSGWKPRPCWLSFPPPPGQEHRDGSIHVRGRGGSAAGAVGTVCHFQTRPALWGGRLVRCALSALR